MRLDYGVQRRHSNRRRVSGALLLVFAVAAAVAAYTALPGLSAHVSGVLAARALVAHGNMHLGEDWRLFEREGAAAPDALTDARCPDDGSSVLFPPATLATPTETVGGDQRSAVSRLIRLHGPPASQHFAAESGVLLFRIDGRDLICYLRVTATHYEYLVIEYRGLLRAPRVVGESRYPATWAPMVSREAGLRRSLEPLHVHVRDSENGPQVEYSLGRQAGRIDLQIAATPSGSVLVELWVRDGPLSIPDDELRYHIPRR